MNNGPLEYHLRILENIYKVHVDRSGGRRGRYYPVDILADESHMLGFIRNNVLRQII
ncbi:MAG TPA: hypothetical protein VFI73_11750 [Candidatus Nitrosopolaris sp.]|nr:hypothetical protein [Candidatus Nitrosopolaris sp.]